VPRKCPECKQNSHYNHLVGCSYAPDTADREEFIKANAVDIVRRLESQSRVLSKEAAKANATHHRYKRWLIEALETLQEIAAVLDPCPVGCAECAIALHAAQDVLNSYKGRKFESWLGKKN